MENKEDSHIRSMMFVLAVVAIAGMFGGIAAAALSDFAGPMYKALIVGPVAAMIAFGYSAGLQRNKNESYWPLLTMPNIALALVMGLGGVDYCGKFLKVQDAEEAQRMAVDAQRRAERAKDEALRLAEIAQTKAELLALDAQKKVDKAKEEALRVTVDAEKRILKVQDEAHLLSVEAQKKINEAHEEAAILAASERAKVEKEKDEALRLALDAKMSTEKLQVETAAKYLALQNENDSLKLKLANSPKYYPSFLPDNSGLTRWTMLEGSSNVESVPLTLAGSRNPKIKLEPDKEYDHATIVKYLVDSGLSIEKAEERIFELVQRFDILPIDGKFVLNRRALNLIENLKP